MKEISVYFIEKATRSLMFTNHGIVQDDGKLLHPANIQWIVSLDIIEARLTQDHITFLIKDKAPNIHDFNIPMEPKTALEPTRVCQIQLNNISDLGKPILIDRINNLIEFEHGAYEVPHNVMRSIHGWIKTFEYVNNTCILLIESISKAVVNNGRIWNGIDKINMDINWLIDKPYILLVDKPELYHELVPVRDDIYLMQADEGIILTPENDIITYYPV